VTRTQLRLTAGLSMIATALVLINGGRPSTSSAAARAAAQRAIVVQAALPATPEPAAAAPVSAPIAPATAVTPAPATSSAAPASSGSGGSSSPTPAKKAAPPKPSKARHVFVIALTGTDVQQAFGAQSAAPYLATDLQPRGTLLSGFGPLDNADLPNYIAMAGGQPPNSATQSECSTFAEFSPEATTGTDGVVSGTGCVYPNTVITIGDQLTSSGRSWRAYSEDMGAKPCRHPESDGPDDTMTGRPGDQYATRHNPFVYFHSLLDAGDCEADDLSLDGLATDLNKVSTTPNYAYIAPNLCDSATESPCVDGSPGGLAAADAFLKLWVPRILGSPAYKADGALLITFLSSAEKSPDGPPRTGALVLSPFAGGGKTTATPYDPYSLLRSVEDLFGLTPLAHAQEAQSFAKAALPGAF
jgi:hypothetical protein